MADAHAKLPRETAVGLPAPGSARAGARWRVGLVVALALLMAGGVALVRPFAQDPAYHAFADTRAALHVPNALNVLSNLAFLVVGVLGFRFLARDRRRGGHDAFVTPGERRPYWWFFTGVALTSVGSAYYHWRPDNGTLFWDRLPMTIGFMAIMASVIGERISPRAGAWSLGPLLVAGVASALYWHVTEQRGAGDLRPYFLVQFGSITLILVIMALFPARYTRTADLGVAVGWYVVGKACEYFDRGLLALTGVSGHTWKHLATAAAAYWVLHMLVRRQPLGTPQRPA